MLLFLGIVPLLVLVGLLVDFLRRRRSASMSLRHQIMVYAILCVLHLLGTYHRRRMERNTRNFMKRQHQLISTILRVGDETQYGRDHELSRMRTLSDFRSRHPVTQYPHYAAYIEAAERGDASALLGDDDIEFFAASSGTTGANKHMPVGRKQFGRILRYCAAVAATTERVYGDGTIGQVLVLTSRLKPATSVSDKRICSLSVILQQSSQLGVLRSVTPPCVGEVETETAACYVGLMFALQDQEMHAVYCSFIYVFLRLMSVLESQWPRLVDEIAAGKIGSHLSLPEPLLKRINAHLTPAPERARALQRIFSEGLEGIVTRVWPHLRFLQAARSGLGGDMYLKLANQYMGGLPVLDLVYCSSEAWLGESDTPTAAETSFILNASSCFYEFLPVTPAGDNPEVPHCEQNGTCSMDETGSNQLHQRVNATSSARKGVRNELKNRLEGGQQEMRSTDNRQNGGPDAGEDCEDMKGQLLLADEVHVGSEYELVVTTRSGLYRYRQGDVVRVSGFHNEAPTVQLLYRTGITLSTQAPGSKISGLALYKALQSAAADWPGRRVTEFAAAGSVLDPTLGAHAAHHLLFLEVSGPRLSEAEAGLVDARLRSMLEWYALSRESGKLGPIRVLQVAPGTFLKLRDTVASRGQAHWSQLKKMHVLRTPEHVTLMMNHVLPSVG